MRFFGLIFAMFFPVFSGWADNNCLDYKVNPHVDVKTYEWVKNISQPDDYLEEHGHVQTALRQEGGINVKIMSVRGGWCVVLDSVDTKIGYQEFNVRVDKKYKKDSCFYNAVLSHEDKHIDVYLAVLDEYKQKLSDTFQSAANSVMPVFISDINTINDVVDEIGEKFNKHPDIVLMMQKVNAELEIRNSKVDIDENGADMDKCLKEIIKNK